MTTLSHKACKTKLHRIIRLTVYFMLATSFLCHPNIGGVSAVPICGGPCPQGFFCNPNVNLCEPASSRTETDGVGGPGIHDAWSCRGKCSSGFYCEVARNKCRRKFYNSRIPPWIISVNRRKPQVGYYG